MKLKLIVNETHLGENISSIKLPKFPVHTVLIACTKTMLFFLETANHSNGNHNYGNFWWKKDLKSVFKTECLYFALIIFSPKPCIFFFALESAAVGPPKEECESKSFQWASQTTASHTSRGSSPESSAAVAAFQGYSYWDYLLLFAVLLVLAHSHPCLQLQEEVVLFTWRFLPE